MTETFHSNRYNPCRGCPDRYPACSDHCRKPEYQAWKDEQKKIKAARQAYMPPKWQHPEATVKAKFGPRKRKN
jgi:endogenous inhibitor of DNA gyrase (YacG/DUF329 family)